MVPIKLHAATEFVASMGYADDTTVASAPIPTEVAIETQALADTLRGLIHALGQRNRGGITEAVGVF